MEWRDVLIGKGLRMMRALRVASFFHSRSSMRSFADYFKGLEKVAAVTQIFGKKTEEILRDLKVEFTWLGGYMRVSDVDGHLVVSSAYMNKGDRIDVYLDLIHELVHVKQFMDGKELFDGNYGYVDRPTEIEAYRCAVEEARRLGLNDERICRYLKTEWMTKDDLRKLAKTLNVKCFS